MYTMIEYYLLKRICFAGNGTYGVIDYGNTCKY